MSKRSNHKSDIPPLRDENGSLLFKDTDKAEALNNFFVSICTVDNKILPPFLHSLPQEQFVDLKNFSTSRVFSQLTKLQNGFSVGPDKLPSIFFKKLAGCLAYPLCLLFNVILTSGILPSVWKLADVVPS